MYINTLNVKTFIYLVFCHKSKFLLTNIFVSNRVYFFVAKHCVLFFKCLPLTFWVLPKLSVYYNVFFKRQPQYSKYFDGKHASYYYYTSFC